MRAKSFSDMVCPVAGALEAIGDRWALLVVRDLGFGLSRYDELQRSTGVPNTTLSDRLKRLEAQGVVERSPYQERPLRSGYRLTPKGRDLWKVLVALAEWNDRWAAAAPPVERFDAATGHPVKLALVDAETGAPVPAHRLQVRAGPGADDLTRWRLARLANPEGAD